MKKSTKKVKRKNRLVEYIGWVGFTILLINYSLLSVGTLQGNAVLYHIFALVGTICIAYEALRKKDKQAGYLNLIFAFVAIFAISRLLFV